MLTIILITKKNKEERLGRRHPREYFEKFLGSRFWASSYPLREKDLRLETPEQKMPVPLTRRPASGDASQAPWKGHCVPSRLTQGNKGTCVWPGRREGNVSLSRAEQRI